MTLENAGHVQNVYRPRRIGAAWTTTDRTLTTQGSTAKTTPTKSSSVKASPSRKSA